MISWITSKFSWNVTPPQREPRRFEELPASVNNIVNFSIYDFPDEVLVEFFSYIKTPRDLVSCQLVCRRWCVVSRENVLWSHLYLRRFGFLPQCPVNSTEYYQVLSFAATVDKLQGKRDDEGRMPPSKRTKVEDTTILKDFIDGSQERLAMLPKVDLSTYRTFTDITLVDQMYTLVEKCGKVERVDFSNFSVDARIKVLVLQAFFNRAENLKIVVIPQQDRSAAMKIMIEANQGKYQFPFSSEELPH